MQAALDAIAEPRRREIMRLVRERELASGQIASEFEITPQAISQHLRVLRQAGLVTERRDGTRRLYRANPEPLAELGRFIEEFWDHRLERLKTEAELEERRSGRAPAG